MRRVERAAALAALVPCVLAGMMPRPVSASPTTTPGVLTPPAAPETATAPQRDQDQVALALTKMSAKADPGGEIRIDGTVTNRSGQAMPGMVVRVRYRGTPVSSRGELSTIAAGQPSALTGMPPTTWPLPQAAAEGGSQAFKAVLDTKVMGISRFGVYPVGVEVVNAAGQAVAGVNTFITYVPKKQDYKPVQVGWVWPLVDRMHRANDQTFLDDQLSKDMAPGGRLRGLVDAAGGTGTPITWAIDPALLDDVTAMTAKGGYVVRPPRSRRSGEATRMPQSAAGAAWLKSLKEVSKSDPYFAVPYADPDAVALVRTRRADQIRQLAVAFENTSVAQQFFGRGQTTKMVWPPSGLAGQSTLNELAKAGLKGGGRFLLTDKMFEPQGTTTTATTSVPVAKATQPALVYDEKLNNIISGDTRSPGKAVLAQQRFLAETAVITQEAPNAQRTLVVTPDRHWNPSPQFARDLLSYTAGARWLSETPLSKIEKAAPQQRTYVGYSGHYERYELGDTYLGEVRAIGRRARSFTSVMVEPIKINYTRAVLRLESAAWRGRPGRARQARQELASELNDQMGQVHVITRRASLAGGSGRIPVTVVNDLRDQTVKLRLQVTPENSVKLRVGELPAKQQTIELAPNEKPTRYIPVQALGNGNFRVRVQLQSADGKHDYGEPEIIMVRTTGYGRLAVLITGGGLAVLFVGVGVRAIRARRRREAEAAGDGSTGMGPAATGTVEPGAPGAGSAGFWPSEPGPAGPGPAGPPAPGSGPSGNGTGSPAGSDAPGPEPHAGPGLPPESGLPGGTTSSPGDEPARRGGRHRGGGDSG